MTERAKKILFVTINGPSQNPIFYNNYRLASWIQAERPQSYHFLFAGLDAPERPLPAAQINDAYTWFMADSHINGIRKLGDYCKANKIDVSICSGAIATITAVACKIIYSYPRRIIARNHDVESLHLQSLNWKGKYILPMVMKAAYQMTDRILSVSEYCMNDLIDIVGCKSKHLVLYNPSFDTLPSLSVDHRSKEQGVSSPLSLVCIAALEKWKNIAVLLKAIAFASNISSIKIRLSILGDGSQKGSLTALAHELGISESIQFHGHVPVEKIGSFLLASDYLVLTSEREAFGNVLVEALSFGCPVIAVDCPGGVAEIINSPELGVLVPMNSVSALGKAIADCALSRHAYCQDVLRRRARDFCVDRIGPEMVRIIDEVCG